MTRIWIDALDHLALRDELTRIGTVSGVTEPAAR
jgi:hypothetical protein